MFLSNKNIVVGWDVDMTLVNEKGLPIYNNIALLLEYYKMGITQWVASGGGEDYSRHIVEKLGLTMCVGCYSKMTLPRQPDIWFDDQEVTIGKINIRV